LADVHSKGRQHIVQEMSAAIGSWGTMWARTSPTLPGFRKYYVTTSAVDELGERCSQTPITA